MTKKRKPRIVWKVVSHGSRKGELFSAFVLARKFRTRYPLGKVVRPKLGKLFAFATLRRARDFCRGTSLPVFRAEATGVRQACCTHLYIRDYDDSSGDIAAFWNGRIAGSMNIPSNTVFCDSIKLLEEVK